MKDRLAGLEWRIVDQPRGPRFKRKAVFAEGRGVEELAKVIVEHGPKICPAQLLVFRKIDNEWEIVASTVGPFLHFCDGALRALLLAHGLRERKDI